MTTEVAGTSLLSCWQCFAMQMYRSPSRVSRAAVADEKADRAPNSRRSAENVEGKERTIRNRMLVITWLVFAFSV